MLPLQIAENIYDVGVQDWAVRDFHGYKTERGATYNSYHHWIPLTILSSTMLSLTIPVLCLR